MARLIEDAAKLSDTVDAQDMSFANIVKAINVVQTEMGITGTTAKEAASTIQGSVGMMKSSWNNLVTGLADENANLDVLIENFVESVGVTVGNILPKVHTVLTSAASLVEQLIPVIMEEIPVLIGETLPQILNAGINVLRTILDGISSNPDEIVNTIFDIIDILIDAIVDLLPDLIVTGALIIGKLAVGLIQAIPELVAKIPQIINAVVEGFKAKSGEFSNIGKNIIEGIKSGISKMWSNLKSWFKNLFGDLIGLAKKILGIASPSKVFKKIGGFTAEGFGVGFEDEFAHVKDDMEDALNFDDASVGINASIRKVGAGAAGMAYGSTSIGNININIDGAKYSDEQSLAEAVAEALQNMTDRRSAVYA